MDEIRDDDILDLVDDPAPALSPWEARRAALNLGIRIDGHVYVACGNPLCERVVPKWTVCCCNACDNAAQGGYEIHESGPLGHSAPCNQRWADRKGHLPSDGVERAAR